MRFSEVILIPVILFSTIQSGSGQTPSKIHPEATEISFETKDGVVIYGDLIKQEKDQAVIMLFHQGGSNARGEYAPIIPRLAEQGYNIIAIDQRQGGQTFGSYNRTVAQLDKEFSYCEAYSDLKATLDFVVKQEFSGDIFAWGSSYSGSLAVKLASEYGDKISGVLAFSPASGGPMTECKADLYFEDLKVPMLLLRPSGELEIESVKQQFEIARAKGFQVHEAKPGTHGASMLVENRADGNVDTNWEEVISFIESN